MDKRQEYMLNNYPRYGDEKNELALYDAPGNIPTGPVVACYHKTGQFYVGGMRAEVMGLDEQAERVILGWKVETSNGWEEHEARLKYREFVFLYWGPQEAPNEKHAIKLEVQELLRARSKFDYIAGELPEPHDFHLLISELGEAWNDQFHPSPESAVELLERLFVALTSGKEWTPVQATEVLQRLGRHMDEYRENGRKWSWEAW